MTYAYNEYGQEIAVGVDVTDYFNVSNQVEVIGEIKVPDDFSDENTNSQNGEEHEDFPHGKKKRSPVVKNYTSSKTKEAKRFKTLLEKKIELQQKKGRQVLGVIYEEKSKGGKGKATGKFKAKNPNFTSTKGTPVKKDAGKKVLKGKMSQVSKAKRSEKNQVSSMQKKKLSERKIIKKQASTKKTPKRKIVHVYARIPQPKRRIRTPMDKEYNPNMKIDVLTQLTEIKSKKIQLIHVQTAKATGGGGAWALPCCPTSSSHR